MYTLGASCNALPSMSCNRIVCKFDPARSDYAGVTWKASRLKVIDNHNFSRVSCNEDQGQPNSAKKKKIASSVASSTVEGTVNIGRLGDSVQLLVGVVEHLSVRCITL